jgi:hypothetical protein
MQNSRGHPLPLSTSEQGGDDARGWRRRCPRLPGARVSKENKEEIEVVA